MGPVVAYVSSQQGGSKGMRDMWGWIVAAIVAAVAIANFIAPRLQ